MADEFQEMTYIVKIKSYGQGDKTHRLSIARFLWSALHRGFGADRIEVYEEHGGVETRIRFNPFAKDPLIADDIREDVSVA